MDGQQQQNTGPWRRFSSGGSAAASGKRQRRAATGRSRTADRAQPLDFHPRSILITGHRRTLVFVTVAQRSPTDAGRNSRQLYTDDGPAEPITAGAK